MGVTGLEYGGSGDAPRHPSLPVHRDRDGLNRCEGPETARAIRFCKDCALFWSAEAKFGSGDPIWRIEFMKYDFEISHAESTIQVRVSGLIDEAGLRELWAAIAKACESHDSYDILGVSELDMPFSVATALDHYETFKEVGIGLHHRIAWVNIGPESHDILEFTETVLVNRGKLNGGLLPSIEEAKQWLREESDSPG